MNLPKSNLDQALIWHSQGNLTDAERTYRQLVEEQPSEPEPWHLLGLVRFQQNDYSGAIKAVAQAISLDANEARYHATLGQIAKAANRNSEAEICFRRACELSPSWAEPWFHLGSLFQWQGKFADALAAYAKAVQLQPQYADALCRLAICQKETGAIDEALKTFRQTLVVSPDHLETLCNLANTLIDHQELQEAITLCHRALQLRHDLPATHLILGRAFTAQGKPDEAYQAFAKVVELAPNEPRGYLGIANLLVEQNRPHDSEQFCRRALQLDPQFAEAHNTLGNALAQHDRAVEAEAAYRQAFALKPTLAEAWSSYANFLKEEKRLDEANAACQRAIELKPTLAEAHVTLGCLSFFSGDWPRGWAELEWRWRIPGFQTRSFSCPRWRGESLFGKTLLVHAEQGLGDTIQFARYATRLKQLGATIIFECQRSLKQLLANVPGIDCLIARGESLPPIDYEVPLLSVPGILGTKSNNTPSIYLAAERSPTTSHSTSTYITADASLTNTWRQQLSKYPGKKIGLNWQGNRKNRMDRRRSVPLSFFAPLGSVPDTQFISLQRGDGVEQIAAMQNTLPMIEFGPDFDSTSGSFMDTAAVLCNLDLVITSDTALAHLAGALGVPVWMALPYVPDFRWLLDRSDSPWYPTMRIFRQPRPLDWAAVFADIQQALLDEL